MRKSNFLALLAMVASISMFTMAGCDMLNGDKSESESQTNSSTQASDVTVTFDADGGSAVDAQSVTVGGTATKPADPTKTGYTFAGWTLDGAAFDFTTAVNADVTLKAAWTANTYKLSFTVEEGTAPAAINVTFDGKVGQLPAIPAVAGYTGAWKIGNEVINANTTYTYAENKTATLVYTANVYKLTMGTNMPTILDVTYGQPIGAMDPVPAQPGKVGAWTIDGQVITADTVWTWTSNQTAMLVYVDQYQLSFEVEEGTAPAAMTILDGTAIGTLPQVPAKKGYTGVWKVDGVEINASTVWNYTENKTAVATYTARTDMPYEVVVLDPEGSDVSALFDFAGSFTNGNAATGFTLTEVNLGEYDAMFDVDETNSVFTISFVDNEEDVITVQLKVATYTVTVKPANGMSDIPQVLPYGDYTAGQIGEMISSQISKQGYSYDYVTMGGNKLEGTVTLDQDIEITVVWKANTDTAYTVKHYYATTANPTENDYVVITETGTGTTDTQTAAVASNKANHEVAGEIEQVNIAGDGSAVVNVYYNLINANVLSMYLLNSENVTVDKSSIFEISNDVIRVKPTNDNSGSYNSSILKIEIPASWYEKLLIGATISTVAETSYSPENGSNQLIYPNVKEALLHPSDTLTAGTATIGELPAFVSRENGKLYMTVNVTMHNGVAGVLDNSVVSISAITLTEAPARTVDGVMTFDGWSDALATYYDVTVENAHTYAVEATNIDWYQKFNSYAEGAWGHSIGNDKLSVLTNSTTAATVKIALEDEELAILNNGGVAQFDLQAAVCGNNAAITVHGVSITPGYFNLNTATTITLTKDNVSDGNLVITLQNTNVCCHFAIDNLKFLEMTSYTVKTHFATAENPTTDADYVVKTESVLAAPGSTTAVTAGEYSNHTLRGEIENVTVADDGSTVVNVYYDIVDETVLSLYTIDLAAVEKTATNVTYSNGNLVVAAGGVYNNVVWLPIPEAWRAKLMDSAAILAKATTDISEDGNSWNSKWFSFIDAEGNEYSMSFNMHTAGEYATISDRGSFGELPAFVKEVGGAMYLGLNCRTHPGVWPTVNFTISEISLAPIPANQVNMFSVNTSALETNAASLSVDSNGELNISANQENTQVWIPLSEAWREALKNGASIVTTVTCGTSATDAQWNCMWAQYLNAELMTVGSLPFINTAGSYITLTLATETKGELPACVKEVDGVMYLCVNVRFHTGIWSNMTFKIGSIKLVEE